MAKRVTGLLVDVGYVLSATTLKKMFSVTYYWEQPHAIYSYCISNVLSTNVKRYSLDIIKH